MIGFPLLDTLWLSLQHFSFGSSPRFAGLGNYAALLHDGKFWQGLRVTLALYALSLVLQLLTGLYLALLLHRTRVLRGLLRTLLVSPFVMPPVVVGMMWLVILDPSLGIANWLLGLVGISPALWLASPDWVVPTVAMIDTWQWAPFVALILLAGLADPAAGRVRGSRRSTEPAAGRCCAGSPCRCWRPASSPPRPCAASICCASSTSSISRRRAAPAMPRRR